MLALALGGLLLLVRRWSAGGFDGAAFLASLKRADWRWLLAGWALVLVSYYGRALRWMVMLRPIAPNARQRDVFNATAIGFSAVVLFGRAGELVRPYLIAKAAHVTIMSQMAAWFLERIYDTLIVLAIFGYTLAVVVPVAGNLGPNLQWLITRGGWFTGVACSLCLALLVGLQRYSDRLEQRLVDALGFLHQHHHEKAERLVRAGMDGLRSARSVRSIIELMIYSALEWWIIYLCFVAIFRAFPETTGLSASSILVYIGFVAFGSIVQIPGIGGGIQIVSIIVLTELFQIGIEPATSIALATWAVTLVGIVPVGIVLAFRQGLSLRKIKELGSETAL